LSTLKLHISSLCLKACVLVTSINRQFFLCLHRKIWCFCHSQPPAKEYAWQPKASAIDTVTWKQ